jgi:RNA polymerase sigma factor (sigma-70 family)
MVAAEASLVARCRTGDAAAFDEIVRRHRPELVRYCRRIVGPDLCEDVVQQALMSAYVALGSGDRRDLALKPWLYRVARNAALDAALAVRHHDRLVERQGVGGIGVVAAPGELGDRAAEALGELVVRGAPGVLGDERALRSLQLPLGAADRPGSPVLAAQLVDDRALDPRPRELRQAGAALGVVAVDRADQGEQPARHEVLGVALGRQVADLAEYEVAHHRRVGQDEAVTQRAVAGGLVALPQR